MGSNKYVGYVGGVAVAVGVGAAIAAASQGVASADTGKSDSSSASDSAKSDAGPKKSTTGNSKRVKPTSTLNDKPSSAAASDTSAVAAKTTSAKTTAVEFEAAQVDRLKGLFAGHAAPRPAAVTPSTPTETTAAVTAAATPTAAATVNPATAFWNPFRWMPPEPAPQDMPGPIWTLEQSFMAVFPNGVKAVAREGFELGYRLTQMIPWVNIIVPVTNIITELPDAFAGDKAAAQRVINNLIVTIHPIAVLYYGYNELADVLNLEAPALQLQSWFIGSLWNLFDPFALLHNRGESGLPLSTTTPPPDQVTPEAATTTQLAAAVTPTASAAALPTIDWPETSDPFRADDPKPFGMPTAVYNTEKGLVAMFPTEVRPIVRELYEASWRISQMVPGLSAAVPIAELLPALYQAAIGHRDTAQVAINNVLLATTALSILYYGYDQLADLLNVEDQAQALKVEIYAAVWDEADPNGYLHVPGHSGLKTV
ncbi:hypothetical protein FHT40_000079 [Mycolicibacterium sp. BK556]|uniref:hypothetical protein n=1 Tax=unclassified Mycolicibacterium TaxID=2636767 RepID=UPI001622B618|nr:MULTISPECIES: hypothetical protein [unclassified Mycolicibacterium]MBB3600446.1 hypothetical protein [Mycolicibacterium sp. BK556]MBB3630198.1 hypothetical protein [Mycolicibacterium sp. BK607]